MVWNRSAVFRKKTKKALSAVRKLFREGRLTEVEKVGEEGGREGGREGM